MEHVRLSNVLWLQVAVRQSLPLLRTHQIDGGQEALNQTDQMNEMGLYNPLPM